MYTDESIIYADIQDGVIVGYYTKEIHGEDIPETAIPITAELHQKLLELPKVGIAETIVMPLAYEMNSLPVMGLESIGNFVNLGYEPLEDTELIEDERVQKLEEENKELKDRLDKLEGLLQTIAMKL